MKTTASTFLFILFTTTFGLSQSSQLKKKVTLNIEPDPLVLQVGEKLKASVGAYDENGTRLEDTRIIYTGFGRRALRFEGFVPAKGAMIDSLGFVTGLEPGLYTGTVIRPGSETESYSINHYGIKVVNAPVAKIGVELPEELYTGTSVSLNVVVKDEAGFDVDPALITIGTADESIATVDGLGNLRLHKAGRTEIMTKAGDTEHKTDVVVLQNPAAHLALLVKSKVARTGDVLHLPVQMQDEKGENLTEIPVFYAVTGDNQYRGAGASALISQDGKFVAETPGVYNVIAASGTASAVVTLTINPRDVDRELEFVGHGLISESHTADFWVWEGEDGRDYAVTGTHMTSGKAIFWDVTNPANIIKIDSVLVDARGVNDVKISEDGKICIISREGASNRKNGIVILDVSNPGDVQVLSTYTDNLTGGVHNLFIYKDHVYALSNGQKYEIINISDPSNPYRVSKFEIENPLRSIHDVWIEDGIAYSSNWADGIIMVDIGNGVAGGSPDNPKEIARLRVEGDANHTAFPFYSKSTGRKYVIAGDEIFPRIWSMGEVILPAGYIHFIDITDPRNPVEVASYEVPEAGSHNFWVEDDVLYIGYYNGGLRVVDISGELMGDLYRQGREIAHFYPMDENGFVPNAAMTWGAQPHKGHIFFTDFNLWSGKIEPVKPDEASLEVK